MLFRRKKPKGRRRARIRMLLGAIVLVGLALLGAATGTKVHSPQRRAPAAHRLVQHQQAPGLATYEPQVHHTQLTTLRGSTGALFSRTSAAYTNRGQLAQSAFYGSDHTYQYIDDWASRFSLSFNQQVQTIDRLGWAISTFLTPRPPGQSQTTGVRVDFMNQWYGIGETGYYRDPIWSYPKSALLDAEYTRD